MQRIYLPNTPFSERLTLSETKIHHQLTRVLRAKPGMSVIFFDGVMQQDIVYRIEEIQKTQIVFQKQEIIPKKSELDFEMILVQALPNKFSKLEYIVQKCSEVGFSQIVFFSSERSQKLHISDQKMKRLTSIMIEAIEQSNRNSFCDIALYDTKQVYDAIAPEETHIVFHPDSQLQATPIREISIKKGQTVRMYVGPEGGFSLNEIEQMNQRGFQKIYLGERVLRCETTGVVTGFFLGQNNI